jgi:membrane peptidoglycan carboxypeptidase
MLPSGSFTVHGDFAWATVAMRARVGRDWVRKAFGAYFTVLIEIGWGKQRIMEVYLNVVEWGPGIYGAEAAARH